ncbi:hypothetical protein FGG08_002840 [Glutinoglossum americanum]|uniref:60S ribosomal protein L27 n=1 Tax=Glutinoglossum americanum TaxID=1670608 RepID=A0A9P8IC64_9PEZI|nr:hypothetical protein FGG08_002840 [Glutinoglossum americanum]
MKFLKVGRVAIITRGRYAGKKVVIIQPLDTGSKSHPFPHALVAGLERSPSQITRRMSKDRQAKRSKVKPFIKVINYNHLMPTRYTLELEGLKGVITNDTFKEVSQREEAKKTVKKALEERYTSGKNRWFFTPLSKFFINTRRNRTVYHIVHGVANMLSYRILGCLYGACPEWNSFIALSCIFTEIEKLARYKPLKIINIRYLH